MRGLKLEDLLAIINILYFGEANAFQENLDTFLVLAEEQRPKGLTGSGNSGKGKEPPKNKENFETAPITPNKTQYHQYQTPTSKSTVIATEKSSIDAKYQDLDD